ncbi:MAG: serine hydrolase [bacterium]
MNGKRMFAAAFPLMLALAAGGVHAGDPDLAGDWSGSIDLPGTSLEIQVSFTAVEAGWSGTITIPAQGAKDLPLEAIALDGVTATFAIKDVPGSPTFTGEFSADGTALNGPFTQGGGTFSFTLVRSEARAAESRSGLEDLGTIITAALEDWQTPGLGLAVVKDGQVVLCEGYGQRDLENRLPVTAQTLFAIGSSTKAFTAYAMGLLVDEGKLDWDEPVREYLPEFALYDEYAGLHITPRDLVTHRSGLPRHDLVWYGNRSFERADLVARLRYLEPNKELRQQWQYNNLMFCTAGYLVGRLHGSTWEDAVAAGIFRPLGMDRSNTSVTVSQADPDHALPYRLKDDELQQVAFRNLDAMGPAGSINSCADDMARWLLANLGKTGPDAGGLKAGTLQELQTPQMVIPGMPREDFVTPAAYGMGWFIDSWRGNYRLQHGGNIDGFSAAVWLFPRDGLGIVALGNRDADALPGLIAATVADRMLGLEPMDHLGTARARREQVKAVVEESTENKDRFRNKDAKPSRKAEVFAGRFRNPGYGVVEFTVAKQDLTMLYNGMTMPLEHWQYDVYSVKPSDDAVIPEDLKVVFRGDVSGAISTVEIGFELLVDPIVFERMPSARLEDPEFLDRLTGRYELPPQVVTIVRKNDRLEAVLPGQPVMKLEPAGDDSFHLSGLSGFSLRFTVGDEGPATEAVFIQPNGVFVAKRIQD